MNKSKGYYVIRWTPDGCEETWYQHKRGAIEDKNKNGGTLYEAATWERINNVRSKTASVTSGGGDGEGYC